MARAVIFTASACSGKFVSRLGLDVDGETLDRGPAAHAQDFGERGVFTIDDQGAVARNDAHQMVELALDRRQVRENVGVVVFQIVQDRHCWPVMNEL